MSIVDADYGTSLTTLRDSIRHGTQLTGSDKKTLIALIEDAVTRMNTISGPSATTVTDGGILTLHVRQEFDILDAFNGASNINTVVAAIATASGVLRANAATLDTDLTAQTAATPTVPTIVTNTVLDG